MKKTISAMAVVLLVFSSLWTSVQAQRWEFVSIEMIDSAFVTPTLYWDGDCEGIPKKMAYDILTTPFAVYLKGDTSSLKTDVFKSFSFFRVEKSKKWFEHKNRDGKKITWYPVEQALTKAGILLNKERARLGVLLSYADTTEYAEYKSFHNLIPMENRGRKYMIDLYRDECTARWTISVHNYVDDLLFRLPKTITETHLECYVF